MTENNTIQEILDNHPEKTTLNFGGVERGFLLGGYAADLAVAKGYDPVVSVFRLVKSILPLLGGFEALKEAGETGDASSIMGRLKDIDLATEHLTDMSVVLWWGLLSFDPDLDVKEVMAYMTPRAGFAAIAEVLPKLLNYTGVELEDEEEEGGKEKKVAQVNGSGG